MTWIKTFSSVLAALIAYTLLLAAVGYGLFQWWWNQPLGEKMPPFGAVQTLTGDYTSFWLWVFVGCALPFLGLMIWGAVSLHRLANK